MIERMCSLMEKASTALEPKLRMAAYCRISSKEDVLLKSLETQIDYFLHLGNNHPNWKLVGLYVDRGKSGATHKNRLGFQRLLRHCEMGKIDVVVTKSISRFSRNAADLLYALRKLRSLKVEVIFEKEGIKLSETDMNFLLSIYATFAEQEVANISQNVEWGFRKRFEQGIPKFDPILGYEVSNTDQELKVSIIPEEASLVNEIYNDFVSGKPIIDIIHSLNQRKIPTKRGSSIWRRNQLTYLLKNDRYLGHTISYGRKNIINQLSGSMDFREDIMIPNTHPPIIEKEIFDKAQAIFESRRVSPRKGQARPLTKRMKCGVCGANYNTALAIKNDYKWKCNIRLNDKNLCKSVTILESDVLKFFDNAAELRFGPFSPQSQEQILLLLKKAEASDPIEEERISFYQRIQETNRTNSGASTETRALLIKSIEQDFLSFEKKAAQLEEDRPFRLSLINTFNLNPRSVTAWKDFTLPMVRALIREVLIFSKSTVIFNWADDITTTIGSPPLQWPTNPIEKGLPKNNAPLGPSQSVKKQQFSFIPPVIINNKHLPLHREGESNRTLKVAAYCRTSTQQEKQEKSLAIQVAYFINMIISNPRWTLVDIYADDGITGTNIDKRPDFKRMLRDCNQGRIDLIITKSVSRFARNTIDCLQTVRDLKNKENPIGIWFEKENLHTLAKTGEMALALYSNLAQEESISFGESIRQSKAKKIESGVYHHPGPPPFGYEINENQEWSLHPQHHLTIKKIFHLYANGKSVKEIEKYLNHSKTPTSSGGKWTVGYIQILLTRPAYKGDILFRRRYTKDPLTQKAAINHGQMPKYYIESHHVPIIDEELWDQVQQRVQSLMLGPSKPREKDTLPKVVYCSQCKSRVIRRRSAKHTYRRCSNSVHQFKEEKCHATSCKDLDFKQSFMLLLSNLKNNRDWILSTKDILVKNPLTIEEQNDYNFLHEELKRVYQSIHNLVKENEHTLRAPSIDLTHLVEKILCIKDKLKIYQAMLDEKEEHKALFHWFLKELAKLPEHDIHAYRLAFRQDLFEKVVSHVVLDHNFITYQLIFSSEPFMDNMPINTKDLELLE